jgi:hypothetical protein
LRDNRIRFFWDESNESSIEVSRKSRIGVKIRDQVMDIMFGPIPSGFVESCIETVRTRGSITSHVFDNRIQFG